MYQRAGRIPPLGIGITSPGKKGISGIREHGRLNVQRLFGDEINPPPPGPRAPGNDPGLASAGVPPMMPTVEASIRGRTNSLVIIEFGIKKETLSGLSYLCDLSVNHMRLSTRTLL